MQHDKETGVFRLDSHEVLALGAVPTDEWPENRAADLFHLAVQARDRAIFIDTRSQDLERALQRRETTTNVLSALIYQLAPFVDDLQQDIADISDIERFLSEEWPK